MNHFIIGLWTALACSFLASSAQGTELTYILEGTITEKSDPSQLVDLLNVGDKVTYTVLVDTEAANLNSTPGFGFYDAVSASLQIGPNTYACESPWVQIIADGSANPTSTFRVLVSTALSGTAASGTFKLVDSDKHAIASASLPILPYDLGSFESSYLSLSIPNPSVYGDYSSVLGSFDSFTIVPEPASLFLLAFAGFLSMLPRGRGMGTAITMPDQFER